MHSSLHLQRRMAQRGISKDMVACVLAYGKQRGDKHTIDRKLAQRYILQLQQLLANKPKMVGVHTENSIFAVLTVVQKQALLACLKKILDKGGVVVVSESKCVITTYNYTKFRAVA